MGRVVVLGSINSDLVVRVPRLPRPGETILGGTFAMHGGGKGANQAIAAARAGAAVAMVGGLGQDSYGDERLGDLQRDGIDCRGVVRVANAASGVALIAVDAAGENVIMVASGANHAVTPAMASAIAFTDGDVLLQQLEIPIESVAAGLAAARRAGVTTLLNAAPWHPAVMPLLTQVDVLIVNEVEAADLLGHALTTIDAPTMQALAAHGPRQVVVTLGGDGAAVWDGRRLTRLPALPVTPVDTTGAGDCCCGVLAAGLATGLPLPEAARRGVVAGSLAVTRAGAQPSLPGRDEIDAALARLPRP